MTTTGGIAAERLLGFIERVERLEEEKAALAIDIREVFAEAKATGFDPKTMRQIVKLRKMDQAERDEAEALLDIYKGALGMLSGTPLGEAAVRRLAGQPPKPDGDGDGDADDAGPDDADPANPPAPGEPEPDVGAARELGAAAAGEGKPVTANPFPPHDPRRAAWDEEWCRAAGSDGMDIPDAWKRRKPGSAGGDNAGAGA